MENKSFVNSAIKSSNLRFIITTGISILLLAMPWYFTRGLDFSYFFVVFAAAILVYSLVTIIRRVSNPSKHPIARNLSRFGDWQQMAREIDIQMAEPHELSGKNSHLTRNWLIFKSMTSFIAIPYRAITWHFVKQVNIRTNLITTHTNYSVLVNDRYGHSSSLDYGESGGSATDLSKKIQAHAPWAFAGYSADLLKIWKKQTIQLIASVDARKEAIEQALVQNQEVTGESEL